jgi:hypothetical protein
MKRLEGLTHILKHRHFWALPAIITLLALVTRSQSLHDYTYELEAVGRDWLFGSKILYLQTWAHASPQTILLAGVYAHYISSDFLRFFADLTTTLATGYMSVRAWQMWSPKADTHIRGLALLASSLLFVPSLWQSGVHPLKIVCLLVATAYYSYARWRASDESYWLFGTTAKNWRFGLLFGVSISGIAFTSPLYLLFIVPLVVVFINEHLELTDKIRWSALFIAPAIIETWVWYSVFAPRELITTALRTSVVEDVRVMLNTAFVPDFRTALIACSVVICIGLLSVRASTLKHQPHIWLIGALLSLVVIVPGFGVAHSIALLILAGIALSRATKLPSYIYVVSAGALVVLTLPSLLLAQQRSSLEHSEVQRVSAYIEQRLMSQRIVVYYGRGAGFYELSGFNNPTRFYNLEALEYENTLALEEKFRGDNEADPALFVVYATNADYKIDIPRLEQYLTKHYTEVAVLGEYRILKRTQSL